MPGGGSKRRPFLEWIDTSGGLDACWPFMGCRNRLGYGMVNRVAYGQSLAHRYVYSLAHPDEEMPSAVMHECDNPPCCNPLHLTGGTHAQNLRQASERGLIKHGEDHYAAKLNVADIAVIRARRESGETHRAIAEDYGVTESHIRNIVTFKSWRAA